MSINNHTPMQEVMFQLETTNSSIELVLWLQNNIARLLEQEKKLVVYSFDEGNDPYRTYRTNDSANEKTKGQEFFENNFINL